ncbi:flagellar assembly protein FliH [Campylobacter hyointestinalis]|uniref:Flagellar assembly protein FliH n=1 Tax=Campylobacter hyointestinalis subsp. hyointestinalis TaxID=91352 RepID=A0A855N4E0_CAMHY|nr:flagellar assembly protein FliH [Campylobacter hyointestinalis]PPB57712.1 flagellar assembly protein FliH [Campylobacter hyointestinalis subsp. hyointestinalis]PPB62548.1 flagellar assembly protein FliH [Campylobacter hyointestinalis subsp. hyointestinalis]PPB71205.1 flagellar assembly protein FliH [Campylobacter hyointestinalis subsp. hyointestinalis]
MILSNVINQEENKEHIVEQYRFKVISSFSHSGTEQQTEQPIKEDQPELTAETTKDDAPKAVNSSEDTKLEPSFIEELLKRTEELSENIVKLQLQIENQEKEFKERLETEVNRAKEDALKEGESLAKAKFDAELSEIETKYTNSIKKLDEEKDKLEKLYQKSEKEIASTAIDIAKEVILKEIKDSSATIASNIAKNLIGELENASQIEIKTNPEDYELVKENIKLSSNLKVSADDAINRGGVIILSDIGNIDGSVAERFEKIKKILSE